MTIDRLLYDHNSKFFDYNDLKQIMYGYLTSKVITMTIITKADYYRSLNCQDNYNGS